MNIPIIHPQCSHCMRFAVLALCVIGTFEFERNSLVMAQAADASSNSVTSGELLIEPPTLINLGFEWFIEGDDNRNAVVEVSYRVQGESSWLPALPLMRLQGERISVGPQFDVIAPNMFAGSVLDLEPDTDYEVRFDLTDPDGVNGDSTKTVATRTRAEPVPYENGRVFHVYPRGFTGSKLEPSFEGLMCAYNLACGAGDFATAGRPRVQPGDTVLMHGGLYTNNRYEYGAANRTYPYEGTYFLTADGTPERPIAIKAAGDGEVIFDGDGNFALFNVMTADYTYFEGITFRNTEFAIWAGQQFIEGAKGLTVKHSRFEDVGAGVFTNYSGSSNFYIADNWFYGRNDPERMIGWNDAHLWRQFDGVDGQVHPPVMASYVAVKVYGPGHVVAYNYIADFHDGINVETYGNPDGSVATAEPGMPDGPKYPPREFWDRRPVAIDFYNNYISNSHDNPIETDGSMHNVRVLRNMLINHPSHAFNNQPVLGGPIYWVRNIGYNLPGGSSRFFGAAGVVFYNNTMLSETTGTTSNTHWRNNLILGQNAPPDFRRFTGFPQRPNLFGITTFTNYSSSDHNGFGPAADTAMPFRWESPPLDVFADFPRPGYSPTLQLREFASLEEYSEATGQDQNSLRVGYDVFTNVPPLDAREASTLQDIYDAVDLDFRLRPGSAAVDKGMFLPTVTDGFTGNAPDLGALELDAATPHYGPRP
ncbi:MAG: hypothetical protein QGG02_12410 [Gammaproteobacteria bacterium]|nr:hypothetical protein [Gammaproteobacteria bacterium]MDP6733546.1 hypothetical protein [Gammaproteobacteria bacterium]